MAEAVISALLEVLFQKITSQVFKKNGPLGATKKEMEKLQSVLSTIQAVLQEAEEKQIKDKALKNWLLKLKDIVYDADDLLDEYMTELKRNQVISGEREICCCVLLANFNTNLLCMSYKMKFSLREIGEKLELVTNERLKFHLRDSMFQIVPFERLESDSYLLESKVFGRDLDEENIVNKLLTDSNSLQGDRIVSVISIVGIGGIGKTTLAKLAYHNPQVERHFHKRIWVCVTEGFNIKRLMKAIVESDTGIACNLVEMEAIHRRVQELIIGKRVLLVLDDVWDDDHEKYERLKNLIRNGLEGSKILITTRYEKVAKLMGTFPPYHLEGLSDDDCWFLFQERAHKNRKQEELDLEDVGKQIAKKCGGVPLAAKALGSLMCLKNQKSQWLNVRDCEMWNLMGDENGILPALRLGYEYLPPDLKQCFAYCSIFPKGYWIKKSILINLWIAEGFIPSSEIGDEYFNELLWRSFFQNVTKDCEDNIVECQMHDLIHDLAKTVAGIDCLTVEFSKEVEIPMGTRHLSLLCNETAPKILRTLKNAKKLRSFLLLMNGWHRLSKVKKSFFLSLKSVRALDFSGTRVKKISKSIGTLLHLRYLNLSRTMLKSLPNSICGLLNLEALILNHCSRLVELPEGLRNLVNLKHLDIYGCGCLTKLPRGIGKMKSLVTLPIYIVSREASNDISELRSIDLGGELMIKNLEGLSNEVYAKNANLRGKRNLLFLKLMWDQGDEMNAKENVERVIEELQPNPSLKKLYIHGYMGVNFPSWLMSTYLVNIVELFLIKCHRCSELPPLGRLPLLEILTVDGMDSAMYFSNDSGNNFVSLEQLTLKNMPNLLVWSSVQEDSTTLSKLKKLTCEGCPYLKSLPNLPSLDSLELHNFSSDLLEVAATKISTLSHLIISECPELEFLPQDLLKNNDNLSSIEIRSCPKLQNGSFGSSSLQSLSISDCGNLNSLLDSSCGIQSSLKSLSIRGCPSLSLEKEMAKGLNALQFLSLSDCEELTTLPVAVQCLKSLQTLHLWSCPKLNALPEWISELSCLRELELWYCENLHSFPESLRFLNQLGFLSIWGCPLLEVRCRKGEGEDWYKIQQVPFIKINGPYIQAMTV